VSFSDCDPKCNAITTLNPLILSLIPNPINVSDGIIITHNSQFDNTYVYLSKDCQVLPITLVLSTYCSLNITNASFLNSIIPVGLTQLSVDNLFLSLEIFIDCKTLILSIKNLFIDISDGENGKPKTQVSTSSIYDTLINGIIGNNSHSVNFQNPSCSFDLTTCDLSSNCDSNIDQNCCRSLVKLMNSQIRQNLSIPPVNINDVSAISILNTICGN